MESDAMDTFAPELRIFGNGDQLVVIFDSLSRSDGGRTARSIQIPSAFKQLSFALEGFDKESATYADDRRIVAGKINLVTVDVTGQQTKHELADCRLVLPAIGKSKKGEFSFPPIAQVEYMVRQGVSDALVAAITDFYAQRPAGFAGAVSTAYTGTADAPVVVDASRRGRAAANDENKTFRRKMALAIVGAPLVIWFVAWGGSKLLTPSSPIEDAVARAMVQDPKSVAAQVELTKQTLQQMGLDPGQSGDIGCLAPQ